MKNEVDATLAFAKSMDFDELANFSKVHSKIRKPKRLNENLYFSVVTNIYWYYAKEIITVVDPICS